MGDIIIKKVSGDTTTDCSLQRMHFPSQTSCVTPPANTYFTWEQTYLFRTDDYITITNFSSLDFELKVPVGDFPIPELRDTCNILVKAEGNSLNITLSFTMKDEGSTSIFTPASCHSTQSITTVQEQLDFWINTFQPNSMEDAYLLTVDGITRAGTVKSVSISKSASSPVLYDVRIQFVSGFAVAGES
jgi:hypothetical protein